MSVISKIYRLQKEMRRTFQEAEVGTYASGAAFFLFLSVIPLKRDRFYALLRQ